MPFFSSPSIILLFLISYDATGSALIGEPKPIYNAMSLSRIIPYNNAGSNARLGYDFSLDFTVKTSLSNGEYNLSASMDTVSTGVAIGAKLMNLALEDVQHHPKGAKALSGGNLWEGFWVPASEVNLTFAAAGLTAKILILAVTERSTCHDSVYGECKNKVDPVKMPTDNKYLGQYFHRLNVSS